jgi:hypothetical protein
MKSRRALAECEFFLTNHVSDRIRPLPYSD